MELDVTWGRLMRIWWAWFWRSLVASAVAAPVAYLGGLWFGALVNLLGLPVWLGGLLGGAAGVILGLLVSLLTLSQILGRNFGDFRLVLLEKR